MTGFFQAHLSQVNAQKLMTLNMKLKFMQFLNELIYVKIAMSDKEKRLNALNAEIRKNLLLVNKKKVQVKDDMQVIKSINEKIRKLDANFQKNEFEKSKMRKQLTFKEK